MKERERERLKPLSFIHEIAFYEITTADLSLLICVYTQGGALQGKSMAIKTVAAYKNYLFKQAFLCLNVDYS